MARGRPVKGPELAQGLDATAEAKRRLKVVLETLSGGCSVEDACAQLGLGEAGFHKMRRQALEAAAERLEGRAPGRRREEVSEEALRIAELEAKIYRMEMELELARHREKVALTMPYLLRRREAEQSEENRQGGKKRRRGRKK